MAGRKNKKAPPEVILDVPILPPLAPAPAPPPPPPVAAVPPVPAIPADPGAGLRNGPKPVCEPVMLMPDSPEALINNVLCREITDPTIGARQHIPDPNITVLDEIAKGISQGSDLNHVRDDALRIASNQPEKVNIVKALMLGVDINRLNRFVQVRDQAEHALANAALRGDLKSTEYLSFLRWSANEIKDIKQSMDVSEIMRNGGGDSAGMLNKMDHSKQAQEAESAKQYKGTTPQGREIIRKQIYDIRTKLQKAGKIKGKPGDPKPPREKKPKKKGSKPDNGSKPKHP